MDDKKEMMDLNRESGQAAQETVEPVGQGDEKEVRQALENAREAESKAYADMSKASTLTGRQKGVLRLAELEKIDNPTEEQLEEKCKLILESYYLPHIAKDGYVAKLNPEFTHHEDASRDYIEAKFTKPNGKPLSIGYNYKVGEDGKNIYIFEKTFQNVILEPGVPERYVLYGRDGVKELQSFDMEQLEKKVAEGEIVKVEQGYFQKAKDENGDVREGTTTPIVEDEGIGNVKIIFGNNEQQRYSIGKNGQLTCATTNDVTTATIETRKFSSGGPVYPSAEAARAAAEKEIQDGETNPKIDVTMEGTTIAEFSYIPTYTTSVELVGLSRKLGKGMEDYDSSVSDEENLRRQFAKPIQHYLDEKGFHVLDIVCEKLEADVSENVGFINTIKTYQMTGGVVSVTYSKKQSMTVSIKQGLLGRGKDNSVESILPQLPAGSEVLHPEEINWKASKAEVSYVMRQSITGTGSAATTAVADDRAAENAIQEAQRNVARMLNGGIASGIREAIAGKGGASTVANVRARLDTPVVSKEDMKLTHKDAKYAYAGSCDRMVTSTENKLVSVTSWHGNLLTYVEATEPVIDKGIPTDDAYDKYINEGDASGILIFEDSDKGLQRYMGDVVGAQSHAQIYRSMYLKARANLRSAQEAFDALINEKLGIAEQDVKPVRKEEIVEEAVPEEVATEAEEIAAEEEVEAFVEAEAAAEEPQAVTEEAPAEEALAASVFEEPTEEMPVSQEAAEEPAEEVPAAPVHSEEESAAAKAALLSIFGEEPAEEAASAPVFEEPVVEAPVVEEPVAAAPVYEAAPAPSAEESAAAKAALLSIFGDEPAEEVPAAPAFEQPAPAAPAFEEPAAAPVYEAAPAPSAEESAAAKAALLSIFGDEPAEEMPTAPAFEQPAPAAPAFEEPVVAPIFEEPVVAAPVIEEPAVAPVYEAASTPSAEESAAAKAALLSIFG
ncbi:MAG: hypothetical protein IJ747_09315, partial [Lachnospiraceae bacterium]|nr:hypothetical protein [Lachnospiraceae bacterium]